LLAAKVKQKTALKERLISYGKLPAHVAIIMDGNGRWAKKRGLPRIAGHRAGVKTVKKIVRAAGDLGIKYLTLFTFSKENWRRPKSEVGSLMRLLYETTKREMEELNENNVRLITTGKVEELSAKQRQILEEARAVTAKNTGLTLNLALNYGGRDEILEAVKKIASDCKEGKLKSSEIDRKDERCSQNRHVGKISSQAPALGQARELQEAQISRSENEN